MLWCRFILLSDSWSIPLELIKLRLPTSLKPSLPDEILSTRGPCRGSIVDDVEVATEEADVRWRRDDTERRFALKALSVVDVIVLLKLLCFDRVRSELSRSELSVHFVPSELTDFDRIRDPSFLNFDLLSLSLTDRVRPRGDPRTVFETLRVLRLAVLAFAFPLDTLPLFDAIVVPFADIFDRARWCGELFRDDGFFLEITLLPDFLFAAFRDGVTYSDEVDAVRDDRVLRGEPLLPIPSSDT